MSDKVICNFHNICKYNCNHKIAHTPISKYRKDNLGIIITCKTFSVEDCPFMRECDAWQHCLDVDDPHLVPIDEKPEGVSRV
jgi:hypothetical protein